MGGSELGNTEILYTLDGSSGGDTAKAWCCPREATAVSRQAAAQVGEVSVAFPTSSPLVQQALHSMQVNTFLSIARGENVMIEGW